MHKFSILRKIFATSHFKRDFAMFDTLTERLTQSLRNVTGSGQLTEDNIKDTLREVRMALLKPMWRYL